VGLENLLGRLDETDTWENCLAREQLQRLGIARILLHQPHWILLQESLDSLSTEDAKQLMAVICEELPEAAILTVTNRTAIGELHHRRINIECPTCQMEMKKRASEERHRQTELTPMSAFLGVLRKDRRKPPSA
jgi:ABC-type uncharacterized transport system fused permease/ATPase subunit